MKSQSYKFANIVYTRLYIYMILNNKYILKILYNVIQRYVRHLQSKIAKLLFFLIN